MRCLFLLTFAAASLLAADANGTWTGTFTPGSQEPGPAYLVLTQTGNTLTGTAGPSPDEQHEISNGKAEDGNLSFDLATGESTMKFVLRQDGDHLKGEASRTRDGQVEKAQLTVVRSKPAKQPVGRLISVRPRAA